MKYIIYCFCFLCLPQLAEGQYTLGASKAKEDFTVFENILLQAHPGLYDHISKDLLSQLLTKEKTNLSDSITDIELYKKLLKISDPIGDGHLQLFAPEKLKIQTYYFPIIVKIIDGEFYTDTNDFELPVGTKITAINDIPAPTILARLKKYVPTDGHNLSRKHREIELKFGLFYAYEFGIVKEFKVSYESQDNSILQSKVILAEPFIKVRLRNAKRSSYFAAFHQQKNDIRYFEKYIGNKDPYVIYKDALKTAILVVNSFSVDIKPFKSKLVKIFKEINKRKIEHLVIDVRNNDGGYRPNAIHLYSFLTNAIFKQRISEFVATLSIPEKDHIIRAPGDGDVYLRSKFHQHPVIDGWEIKFDELETIMVPNKNKFKGKNIYVLTSGVTFSAGTEFVLNAKNNPEILVLGEETGGGYYQHIGDYPIYYELPNSKIVVVLFMQKVMHYVTDNTLPKHKGILPDKYIKLTVEDLKKGTDPILDYIYRLISPVHYKY
ncbi:S41 family peptidase [Aquimarina brevivitae]|uniref:Peptidase S41-like protein n=1 Tax=Aquimarina brevivitae TaxID=323412 RepID=A0A4Q7NYW9_9FLAO|nr:S41 family peptidase [Aquimarina brevivitae]RZS92535.1 peptidase S41-like protein [Aquimarina brevivitae]